MTKLLEKALEAIRRLPAAGQDEIARAIMRLIASDDEPEAIDPSHLPAVLEGLAQAKRRDFATPDLTQPPKKERNGDEGDERG